MFRKCITICLIGVITLSLSACGKNDRSNDSNTISDNVSNKNSNKYGYQIGKPIYVLGIVNDNIDDVSDFHSGCALVRNSTTKQWAIINLNGELITDYIIPGSGPSNTVPNYYNEDLFRIDSGKYLDNMGNVVIDYPCSWSDNFYDGYAAVYDNKTGKYGFIDKDGKEVIPYSFDYAELFSEGLAAIKKDGKWGYIDTKGNIVVDCKYDNAGPFCNGIAWVCIKENNNEFFIYINKYGIPINNTKYYYCDNFNEGIAAIRDENGNVGFINLEGEQIIPFEYKSEGAIYTYTGVHEKRHHIIAKFSSGLARVCKINHIWEYGDFKLPVYDYGFIDMNGNTVIDFNENHKTDFNENLAKCQYYSKYVKLDINENLSSFYNDGKFGMIDTNGDFVIAPIFDKISNFSEGFALAKYNEKILILTYLNPYDLGYTQYQLLKTKNILLKNDQTGYFASYYKQLEDNGDSVIIDTSNWKEKDYKEDLDKTLKKKEAKPNTWYVTDAGIWYYFEEDRTTNKTGWYNDPEDNQIYYLHPETGIMATGWTEIDGDMYYFNEEHSNDPNWFYVAEQDIWASAGRDVKSYGSMFKNETTPDGKKVDEKGRLIGSNDASNEKEEAKEHKDTSKTLDLNVKTVTFGKYEQDNNTSNGAEDIEWLVLDNDGENALLLSKYCLDSVDYNKDYSDDTWETSYLRSWLNDTFIDKAFTSSEKSKIITTNVPNPDNTYFTEPSIGGNDTNDKLFVLSKDEVNEYFETDELRRAMPTAYAKSKGSSDEHNIAIIDTMPQKPCEYWAFLFCEFSKS